MEKHELPQSNCLKSAICQPPLKSGGQGRIPVLEQNDKQKFEYKIHALLEISSGAIFFGWYRLFVAN
jgi:hypothetical protein